MRALEQSGLSVIAEIKRKSPSKGALAAIEDPVKLARLYQQGGTDLKQVVEIVKALREKTDIPLILFSYYNPILAVSSSNFFQEASEAGVDDLLMVDCPLEESHALQQHCSAHHLALIYVVTPSTSMERLELINTHAQGFLYNACRKGTTGVRSCLPHDFSEK